MSKQPRVALDPDTLKPIIEAMIFASEEPLSARALLRLLAGDRENERPADEVPPLEAMMAEADARRADAEPAAAESPEPAEAPDETEPSLPDTDREPEGEELPEVETAHEAVEDAPVETEPVEEPVVETTIEEVVTPSEEPAGEEERAISPELQEGIEEAEALRPEGSETMDAPIAAVATIAGPGADDKDDFSEAESAPRVSDDDDQPAAEPEADTAIPSDRDESLEGDRESDVESMDIGDLVDAMERAEVRPFAAERREIPEVLDQAYLRAMIDELNDEYDASGRAFRIVEVAGGFQFATVRDYGEFVAMLSKDKARRRLSPAALETLAILAYRQPVSKPEVEAIRGVNCDQVLLSLMEKNLIAITGRSEAVGRPLLYGTTEEFLRIFGLRGIGDLPKLREIEELMEEDAYSAERAEVITVDAATDAEEIEAKVGAAGQSHHHDDETAVGETGVEETGAGELDVEDSPAEGETADVETAEAETAEAETAGVETIDDGAVEEPGGGEGQDGEMEIEDDGGGDAGEIPEPIDDAAGLDQDRPNGVADDAGAEADGEMEHDIRTA